MTAIKLAEWRQLPVSLKELCIDTTLRCGQSFRWRQSAPGEYSCALHGRILSLRQDATHLHYRALFPPAAAAQHKTTAEAQDQSTQRLLTAYLNLSIPLGELYTAWSAADPNFAAKAPAFAGVRILRQDAWEALVCFICSSNNNIARIMQMVRKLCERYGAPLGHVPPPSGKKEDKDEAQDTFFDFPTPDALAQDGVEAELRRLGFGYRAKYIAQTAKMVQAKEAEHGTGWLETLRNPDSVALGAALAQDARPLPCSHMAGVEPSGRQGYRAALDELIALQGVGPKVADCVALMGLGWGEAVPVDTHVWQIACRDYRFKGQKQQTLNKVLYESVAGRFRQLWGAYAGWAHSVLFAADLRALRDRSRQTQVELELPVDIQVKQEEGGPIVEDGERARVAAVKVPVDMLGKDGASKVKVEEQGPVHVKPTRMGLTDQADEENGGRTKSRRTGAKVKRDAAEEVEKTVPDDILEAANKRPKRQRKGR